jgi:hypothetical protein
MKVTIAAAIGTSLLSTCSSFSPDVSRTPPHRFAMTRSNGGIICPEIDTIAGNPANEVAILASG